MADKSPYQEFNDNWNKRINWAQGQGIPSSAITPVIGLDAQRLKNGDYIYSDAEAYRALQASATMTDPVQSKPISSSLNPTNVVGNFFSDMRNFYSGLGNLFVHPMGDLIDPVIHGVEGLPKTLGVAMSDIESGNWTGSFEALSKNQLLDFLPGVSDLGTLASQGIDGLIEHPFYSVIDVAPWGRVLGRAAELTQLTKAGGELGEASRALASKGGLYALGAHAVGKVPLLGKDVDEAGNLVRRTVGSSMDRTLKAFHLDKVSKDLFGERGRLTEELQGKSADMFKELSDQVLGSSDVDAQALYDAITTGNRDDAPEALRNNDAAWQAATQYTGAKDQILGQLQDADVDIGMVHNPLTGGYEIYSPKQAAQVSKLESAKDDAAANVDSLDREYAETARAQAVGTHLEQMFQVPVARNIPTDEALQPSVVGIGKSAIGKSREGLPPETPGFQYVGDEMRQYRQLLAQYRNNPEAISQLASKGAKKASPQQVRVINGIDEKLSDVISAVDRNASPAALKVALRALKAKLDTKFIGDMRRHPTGLLMTGPMPELRERVNTLLSSEVDERAGHIGQYKQLQSHLHTRAGSVDKHLRSLEVGRQKLLKARDDTAKEYKKWFIENQPSRFTPLMRKAILMRQIARMYLHKEYYPLLADKAVPEDVLAAMRKAVPDEGDKEVTVNDLHAALQLSSLMTSTKVNITGEDLVDLAQRQMMTATGDETLKGVMAANRDIFDKEFQEAGHTWQALADLGYHPQWIPTRTADDVMFAKRPWLDMTKKVSDVSKMYNATARDMNEAVRDPVVALHAAAVELLTYQSLVAFHEGMIKKLAVDQQRVDHDWNLQRGNVIRAATKNGKYSLRSIGVDESQLKLKKWLPEHYHIYDPAEFKIKSVDYASWFDPNTPLYLPKFVYDGLQAIQKSEHGIPGVEHTVVRANAMFKTTLLTFSPRYAFHMSVGTAFMTMIKTDPLYLRRLGAARQLIKDGKVPSEIPMHTAFDDTAVPIHQFLASRTMGRLFQESVLKRWADANGHLPSAVEKAGAIVDAFHHHVTMVNNMQRVAVYLEQLERHGGDDAAKEQALALTTKIFGDTRRMAPIERQITKTMIPFYGWTRTILGFALSLPVDNPWRVMILGNLSEMEQNDWNSSLPDNMKYLMFLGNPDAQGNVTAIDVRGIDPMRDVGTYFTMAGFISMFTPYIQVPLNFMGINPETATPELYPDITYNDFYGTEQAGVDYAQAAANSAEAIVPQLNAIDYAFGISSQMKYERANDTKGFAYTLADYLNMPYLPQHINLRQEVARTTVDQYSVLEQQVENALATNNFSSLMGYNAVPYRGWDVDPRKLKAVSAQLQTEYGVPANQTLSSMVPYSRQAQGIDTNNPATNPATNQEFPNVSAAG